jgi:peptide/nickel transport system permease protein
MAKFIIRRFLLLLVTMLIVSVAVFLLTESAPGNVARTILGQFVTPEQEASFLAQVGLDKPAYLRYLYWIAGSDWQARRLIGLRLRTVMGEEGYKEWWTLREDGKLVYWKLEGEDLVAVLRNSDGSTTEEMDNGRWQTDGNGVSTFWGVDNSNTAVKWEKGAGKKVWTYVYGTGWFESSGAPIEFIPLQKGFIRGDPGISLRTGRPVSISLFSRLRNSLVLAMLAFVVVMPISLLLGIIAGLKEGSFQDRALSVTGMMFTVIPMFVTGIFLILIFSIWLKWLPGASIFSDQAPWTRPRMLILPLLTLTLAELGYILRITRASMVETMRSAYIRTALLKGLPYRRVVLKHAVRNALMAPITVIMLQRSWRLGGMVIVGGGFGYPGLGKYILESALYKDVNAIEASVMVLVVVAVGSQLIADIIYTFLNPRIRYG